MLVQLRVPVSHSTFNTLVGTGHMGPSHTISKDQCKEFILYQLDSLLSTFQQFDVSGDGRITESDLLAARTSLKLSITDADIKKLINTADANMSGAVVRDATGAVTDSCAAGFHGACDGRSVAGIRRVLLHAHVCGGDPRRRSV